LFWPIFHQFQAKIATFCVSQIHIEHPLKIVNSSKRVLAVTRNNEAIFQLMMLAYNLFLLFKMDFAKETEYRHQIKTFRLKYIFLAGKIIRTARSVMMKLSEKYTYREIYEKSLS
jgi:hypothetical protein